MDMDDPAREAGRVIWEVAGASSPDKQIAAVKKYFLEDASFTYPIFDIPRRPGSRNLIIGTYLFYRNVVRSVRYDIKSVAFDELHGKLYVELVQFPNFIFLTWLLGRWKVRIHMHVHLCMFWRPSPASGKTDHSQGWNNSRWLPASPSGSLRSRKTPSCPV